MAGPASEPLPASALALCAEDQGPMIIAIGQSLLAIAIITVILRVHLRLGLHHGLKSDDYTMVASLVAAVIGTSFLTKLVVEGMGRHVWCLQPEQLSQAVKWSVFAQIFNIIGIGLAKISVCLCVLRIIDRTRHALAIFLWVVIAFVSASHVSQVTLFLVQCRPMVALWNPNVDGKCFSAHITYLAGYIGFGLDAFTDLICAGIPIFILQNLRINRRTRLALCFLIGLGSLTASCAIAKAILLKGVFAKDFTWGLVKPGICTTIEHLGSITLISLPALKPLFDKTLNSSVRGISKYGHKSHRRGTPAGTEESYALDRSWRSDDTERAEVPLCDTILKTTDFRVSSHHSLASRQATEDGWPVRPLSFADAGMGGYEKSMGNSWSKG